MDYQLQPDRTDFRVGDTIKIYIKIPEGDKHRIQLYEGVVIARQHSGITETMTVRKISEGVGVERIFPIHSPIIDKIEITKHGKVRRAKLYYLRERIGKSALFVKSRPSAKSK